ncbi:MAG: LysM peptidoglycan-binding domain-containing protein [Aquamicrobium sp.]|uniref:LysM peptidoglycan-binding domain-containing protein n=1 Tax=Aquamicrobium sp. TaxID=1872579 RepID=UPI00349EC9AC|nr:LysM peptidoglycan-binding domain-containing protein [Aquamicrobium sp.]
MAGWVKALLFLFGGVGAAAGTAYVTGALDPWLAPKPPEVSGLLQTPDAAAPREEPAAVENEGEDEAEAEPEAAAEGPATTPKTDRLAAPVFDVLRVEPDGSVLVAGKASARAEVEVLSGEAVLGKAAAGPEGDFVVLLDEMLKPGDYRLALRATSPEGETVLSDGTAIVSIPEAKDGQVLAMVEEPGQPAELISVPQAPATAEGAAAEPAPESGQAEAAVEEETPAEAADVAATQTEEGETAPAPAPEAADAPEAAAEPADEPAAPAAPQPAAIHTVSVEAVEIEGDTIFVAGRADAGRTVRVYAGTVLLGDAVASEGGRFLVEAKRHLDVGNYLIRADLLGDDGSVVARAGVPFEREPGEAIAAVAPAAPATGEPAQAAPGEVAAGDEPQPAAPADAAAEPEAEAEVAVAPAAPAGEEDEATAPPLQRVDGAVIIRRGDSLWRISRRVYGHGIRYSTIYLANQDQIHNPNRIWPGQVFTLPGETPEGEQADLEAIGEQAVKPEERETTTAQ